MDTLEPLKEKNEFLINQNLDMAKALDEIKKAIRAVRKSDCGGWMKDCGYHNFTCAEGRAKRIALMKCLDKLYKTI